MHKDERDLLDVLKFELEFLEKGRYRHPPRDAWRPQFIFEDSPTCMNYDCKDNPVPCSECVLMQLVPPEMREEKIPCRHIPMNESGETLDSLYRYADECEVENIVRTWLRDAIARLEEQRRHSPPAQNEAEPAETLVGVPLHQNLHPKCANPACASAFHWLAGGKFLRFRPGETPSKSEYPTAPPPQDWHHVKHYWLCERCRNRFTLVCVQDYGVVLKLLWPELPAPEPHNALDAA